MLFSLWWAEQHLWQAGILCRYAQSRRSCSSDWLPCASVGTVQGGGPASVRSSFVGQSSSQSPPVKPPCAPKLLPFCAHKLALLDGGALIHGVAPRNST